jgi:hypothetical protein
VSASRAIGTEAAGARRRWVAEVDHRHRQIESALANGTLHRLGGELVRRRTERPLILAKVRRRLGDGAHLIEFHPRPPTIALFAFLRHGPSTVIHARTLSDVQPSTVLHYLAVGAVGHAGAWATGLWSIELSDHAAGRYFERLPGLSLTDSLLEAHRNLLALREAQLLAVERRPLFLAAGATVFAPMPRLSHDATLDDWQLFMRCETVFARRDTGANKAIAVPDRSPGARLGERLLRPALLRERAVLAA